MAEPPHSPDHGVEAGAGTPRWVKVFGIIALIVALLFVVMLLVGGDHGPGRHTGSPSGQLAPSGTAEHGAR